MAKQRIFISYRREDTKYPAHLLYERLAAEFGEDRVFMDISDIPFGVNFREHIRAQMRDSAICLALIGPQWLHSLQQRADDPRDFVRIELELAHELGVRVIPVTFDDAVIPQQEELPASLRPLQLAEINSQPVRGGADLKPDLDRLVAGLNTLLEFASPAVGVVADAPLSKDPPGRLRWPAILVAAVGLALVGWWLLAPGLAVNWFEPESAVTTHRLELALNVATADVEIDGQPHGEAREFELASGTYRIVVRASGYETYETVAEVTEDQRLNIDLVEQPQALTRTLTLRSNVHDDRVFVDGRELGSTKLEVQLPDGEYEIRIEKAGYRPYREIVELREDTTIRAELRRVRSEAAPPTAPDHAVGDVFRDRLESGGEGPPLVALPAGRYFMGSPQGEVGRADTEGPRQAVDVPSFAIGEREITRGEFARFTEATGYRTSAERSGSCELSVDFEYVAVEGGSWRNPGYRQSDAHPAVCLTKGDAEAYIDWLAQQTGEAYRLPSEAEWEYAARAGTQTSRWWGNAEDAACRHANVLDSDAQAGMFVAAHGCGDGSAKAAPVGSYDANGFGLHDMLGNVWEWTADCWQADYAGAPVDGSARRSPDDANCAQGVVRGGGWESTPHYVRAATRLARPPDVARSAAGFRVARSL